jgi:putative ABC transport system permease protein
MIRSFVRLSDVDPGFNPDRLLTAHLQLPTSKYPETRQQADFYNQLVQAVGALPGVEAAGAINHLPLDGSNSSLSFHIEGRPLPPAGEAPPATNWRAITPDYFRAMGIGLLQGRVFNERDTAQSPAVVVINETMARRFWPGENPLGRRIRPADPDEPWAEIVGIAHAVKHWGVDRDSQAEAYYPHVQQTVPRMTLVVRSVSEPAHMIRAVSEQVNTLDHDLPVSQVGTMERRFAESVSGRRFSMLMMGVFAATALLLAAIGLYGLIAYSVEQRTREMGVRMALGARRLDVLRLLIGQGMIPAFAGIAIGLTGSLASSQLIEGLLFGVSATDPLAFAGAAVLLAGVALLACYLPARRAARVDPVVALRRG